MYGRQITTSVQLQAGNPEIQLTSLYVGANSAAMADIVGVPTGATDVKVVVVKPGSTIPWEYNCKRVGGVWRVAFTNETFQTLGDGIYEVHFKMPTYYFSSRGKLKVGETLMQGIVPQIDPSDPEAGRYVVLTVNGKKPDGNGNVEIDIAGAIEGKADKVARAVAGNLAALTADGNLADSGKNAASFAAASDFASEIVERKAADEELKDAIYGNGYSLLKNLREYLWLVEYRAIDYKGAEEFLKAHFCQIPAGNCSAIRNGRWFGRNYDWLYNEQAQFIVRTEAHDGKHRTIGMACGGEALTDELVRSRARTEWMRVLPCMVSDGINDASVFACVNVVPRKAESGWHGDEVCFVSGVRHAIDNFSSAAEAAADLAEKVWLPDGFGHDVHFVVGDRTETWLVEDGRAVEITDRPWVTNYRVATDATAGGSVDFGAVASLDPYGQGLERMNVILGDYASANTAEGMRALLQKLKYTLAYAPEQEPFWFTEYCGKYPTSDLTVAKAASDTEAFSGVVNHALATFNHRTRKRGEEGYGTWHTVSSVVYDVYARRLVAVVQEEEPAFAVEARLDGCATTTMDGLMSAADKEKLDKGGSAEGKADKVRDCCAGNVASLTADGNLADSGVSKSFVQSRMTGYLEDTENPNTKILVLTSGAVPNA